MHVATGLSAEQKTAYRIMDNKSQDFSAWDKNLLSLEFQKLAENDFDLDLTGFDMSEINKITDDAFLEFESPDLEMSENDWGSEDVHIPETNVKQFMLLFSIEDIEKFKKMIEVLRDKYKIESPSDVVFKAVTNEFKNTSL